MLGYGKLDGVAGARLGAGRGTPSRSQSSTRKSCALARSDGLAADQRAMKSSIFRLGMKGLIHPATSRRQCRVWNGGYDGNILPTDYGSKVKMRFQSSFMLMTVQPFVFASAISASLKVPTFESTP
jgi:hypothetical protein